MPYALPYGTADLYAQYQAFGDPPTQIQLMKTDWAIGEDPAYVVASSGDTLAVFWIDWQSTVISRMVPRLAFDTIDVMLPAVLR